MRAAKMTRRLIATIATTTFALATYMAVLVIPVAAQAPRSNAAAPAKAATAGAVPRMADGHPDLTGVWWTGGDVGGAQFGQSNGSRVGGARGTPAPTFPSLYKPDAAAKAKTLSDKDDPTLRCVPTAFGTLNVSLFDVGAVGQIIATPKMVVMLAETYHGFRVVPTDGRPHRDDVPPAYRGESVGRWEGDAFVVDTRNFTDNTWISAEGRVSPHSDQLHIVERYRRVDANTLQIDATLDDPEMLTKPWVVPTQKLVLAPFDRIMPLNCTGVETQGLMDGAAKQSR
jgi:hypothetical protein